MSEEKKEENQDSILIETKKRIEAVLFSAGRTMSLNELKKLCNLTSDAIVKEAVKELMENYKERNSPLMIVPEAEGWKLTTREKYLPLVQQVNPHTELSKSLIETLAVIAWKQPIFQSELIRIRTNKAYDDVKNLLELGFISKEKRGRSFLLKATGKFFDYFDLPTEESAKELFKGFEGAAEAQKKMEETIKQKEEAKKEESAKKLKKLGGLNVYETTPEKEKFEEPVDLGEENLGKLKVYESEEKNAEEESGEVHSEEEKSEEISIPSFGAALGEEREPEEEVKEEAEEQEEETEKEEEQEEKPSEESSEEKTEELPEEDQEEPQEEEAEETEERKLNPLLEEFAEEEKTEKKAEEKKRKEQRREKAEEAEEKKETEKQETEERDEFYRKKKKGPGIEEVLKKHVAQTQEVQEENQDSEENKEKEE